MLKKKILGFLADLLAFARNLAVIALYVVIGLVVPVAYVVIGLAVPVAAIVLTLTLLGVL